MVVTLKNLTPKARKEHKCSYCGEIIKKGETYDLTTCVFDGDIYDWKAHLDCIAIVHKLKMYDGCDEGLDSETFQEYIRESFNELDITQDKYDFEKMLYAVIKHHLK